MPGTKVAVLSADDEVDHESVLVWLVSPLHWFAVSRMMMAGSVTSSDMRSGVPWSKRVMSNATLIVRWKVPTLLCIS